MHTTEESTDTCLMEVETQTEILPSGPVDVGIVGGDGPVRAEEDAAAAADAVDQDPFGLDDPAPCAEPVDGASLLHEIVGTIRRHVSVTYDSAVAMALWTIFTYAHDAFSVSPLLCFCSPEKRCGKTTVMTLLCALVRKALLAANISPAAVYRTIGEHRPTLLVDEADTFLRANLPLRGILNAGHTRATAKVIRAGGGGFKPQAYSTWCPKVVALIGKLSGTLEDRSIVVPMRRKAVTESLTKLGSTAHQDFAPLRSRIARWVLDNDAALRAGRPGVPESLNDRAADNWTPLLTIADLAGGEWPEAARRAAVAMVPVDQDEENLSVALLRDVRRAFAEANRQRLFTADLIDRLTAMEESPWRTARGSHRLDPHMLAMSLKPYEIMPTLLRVGNKVGRGYDISACQDAFERYLPAARCSNTLVMDKVPAQPSKAPSDVPAIMTAPTEPSSSYTVTSTVVNLPGVGMVGSDVTGSRSSTVSDVDVVVEGGDEGGGVAARVVVGPSRARSGSGEPFIDFSRTAESLVKAAREIERIGVANWPADAGSNLQRLCQVCGRLLGQHLRSGDEDAVVMAARMRDVLDDMLDGAPEAAGCLDVGLSNVGVGLVAALAEDEAGEALDDAEFDGSNVAGRA